INWGPASVKLDDVINTPGFAADPFPVYPQLQDEDPVQWSAQWSCWVVTRYDDVRACLQDARRFSNVGRITGLFQRNFDAAQLAQLKPLIDHYSHGLINIDPPRAYPDPAAPPRRVSPLDDRSLP
ncbi:MAG: hypothetical protein ACO3DQ_06775, partial [Cephaloticoccus sp.]